jgi:DNA (cytosine-5)-methyltransferase 1
MGYHRAGFDVVGVDINPQPHYPFEFVQADALGVLRGMVDYPTASGEVWRPGYFDAVDASPPCQWGTAYRRRPNHVKPSKNLVPSLRGLLLRTGLPFVIEQPENNREALIAPFRLCGSSFGLDVRRHRCFEAHGWWPTPRACDHSWQTPRFPQATNRTMGINWMNRDELSQAIPPAYTEFIGAQLLAHLGVRSA